jgi:hypothetical protein
LDDGLQDQGFQPNTMADVEDPRWIAEHRERKLIIGDDKVVKKLGSVMVGG